MKNRDDPKYGTPAPMRDAQINLTEPTALPLAASTIGGGFHLPVSASDFGPIFSKQRNLSPHCTIDCGTSSPR
jgi:hypothetical protein